MQVRTRIAVFIALVSLAVCQSAMAQYDPGTGTSGTTTTGSPGYTAPSGGYKANKALIGGLIGGGAAAGAGIWYMMHHRNVMRGCIGPDGKTLVSEKDGKTFQLADTSLTPGERVALKARKADESTLNVEDVKKDYGRCEQPTNASSPSQ